MIIGDKFAWGHLGRTGGDTTRPLFSCLKGVELKVRPKHARFSEHPLAETKEILVMNIRRLPSYAISLFFCHKWHGGVESIKKNKNKTLEDYFVPKYYDNLLESFMKNREIGFWIRMENLKEDFIKFAKKIKSLSDEEIDCIKKGKGKGLLGYNHDLNHWFTAEKAKELYKLNPTWYYVEESAYKNSVDEYIGSGFKELL